MSTEEKIKSKEKIEITLSKEGENEIKVTCPANIKLTVWQTYAVLRFDFPPLNITPKDWKGMGIIGGLFIAMLAFIGSTTTIGIILGLGMLVLNYYFNMHYYKNFIQKKIKEGYKVSSDQENFLKAAGINFSATTDSTVSSGSSESKSFETSDKLKKKFLKPALGIAAAIVVISIFIGLSGSSNDEYVEYAKSCSLNAYPNTTLGEGFNSFLSNPKWEHIVADDGYDYVNISGGMTYDDDPVDLLLQYQVDPYENYIELNAMELNGLSQNLFMYNSLIEVVFEE